MATTVLRSIPSEESCNSSFALLVNNIMMIDYCTAATDNELRQILSLQESNHASTLSVSQADRDGFVTVKHSLDLLRQMNDAAQQVIAKDDDRVVGYALVMLESFADMIPILQPMFERLGTLQYNGRKLTEYAFYVMGQICVDEHYRGRGIFDSLYSLHKDLHRQKYDLCITSVSTRNKRSMRAHERVGFETIHTFRDAVDEWNILVWQLN